MRAALVPLSPLSPGASLLKPGTSPLQVGDFTLAQLSALRWKPGGQRILSVNEAVALTKSEVDCVTLDVKTYADK